MKSNSNKYLICFLTISVLFGCAEMRTVPENHKSEARKTLNGKCYDLFTNKEPNGYQMHFRGIVANLGKAVFALAESDSGSQLCEWAGSTELIDQFCLVDCLPNWSQLEALALSKCENEKKLVSSRKWETCRVFARNDEIIWKKDEVKFQ